MDFCGAMLVFEGLWKVSVFGGVSFEVAVG